jgi:ATP synthase protein I
MAVDDPSQDPELPQDARLDSLEERLRRAQQQEDLRTGKAPPADANEQMGQKALSYLIGGLLGGTLLGWLLDRWLGTWPVLFISLMVLGTIGGFWSIIKMSSRKR